MARINMELVVDDLGDNFKKVLKAVVDEAFPGNEVDSTQLMRIFRNRLERGFGRWEIISDRSIDTGY
jgi:hypothetical protein